MISHVELMRTLVLVYLVMPQPGVGEFEADRAPLFLQLGVALNQRLQEREGQTQL